MGVAEGEDVELDVGAADVGVGVDPGISVGVGVAVGPKVGIGVSVGVSVGVGVAVGIGVGVGVAVGATTTTPLVKVTVLLAPVLHASF